MAEGSDGLKRPNLATESSIVKSEQGIRGLNFICGAGAIKAAIVQCH
jgi:hypothetical protein